MAIDKTVLQKQLRNVLHESNFDFLGKRYVGKVRDCYVNDERRYFITSDRLSCFDAVVTTIPYKGQVLNELALYWFKKTADVIPNHIIAVPDPNVIVVKNVQILPVEVIVRGYITGSAWRDYQAGKTVSGVVFPSGMKCNQKLDEPVITPSTKAAVGEHDMPISEEEIVKTGLVEAKIWQQVHEVALELFKRGQEEAAKRGLILVDTKYELGLLDGKLVLADEIHTLDSSRYWLLASYDESFKNGTSPKMLDKEPVRQWLLAQGYQGNGTPPAFSDEYRIELAEHYISSFEQITGQNFKADNEDILVRIEKALKNFLA